MTVADANISFASAGHFPVASENAIDDFCVAFGFSRAFSLKKTR